MAAPRSPVRTPSSGSRWAGSIGVTASRRRPRVEPTKSATKSSAGPAQQLGGGRVLRQAAALGEDRHPVAHPDGLVDVVGHQHDGLAELTLQPQELVLQVAPHDRVDRAEGLVHEQHRRVRGQGPGHPDALPLTARELVRVAVGVRRRVEADELHQLLGPGARPGAVDSP